MGVARAKIRSARKGLWGQEKGCFPFEIKDVGLVEGKGPRKLSAVERSSST